MIVTVPCRHGHFLMSPKVGPGRTDDTLSPNRYPKIPCTYEEVQV